MVKDLGFLERSSRLYLCIFASTARFSSKSARANGMNASLSNLWILSKSCNNNKQRKTFCSSHVRWEEILPNKKRAETQAIYHFCAKLSNTVLSSYPTAFRRNQWLYVQKTRNSFSFFYENGHLCFFFFVTACRLPVIKFLNLWSNHRFWRRRNTSNTRFLMVRSEDLVHLLQVLSDSPLSLCPASSLWASYYSIALARAGYRRSDILLLLPIFC